MNTLWKWLDGKKTVLGLLGSNVIVWLLAKGVIDPDDATLIAALLSVWTGTALVHRGVKASTIGKVLVLAVACMTMVGCSRKSTNIELQPAPDVVKPAPVAEALAPQPALVAGEPTPMRRTLVVHFAFDSDELTPRACLQLDGLPLREGQQLQATGHTCPIGTDEYNDGLSLRRLQAVGQYLARTRHVGMTGDARGERDLVATDPSEYWRNRRVEITY